jgi:hypothetical protein
MDPEGPTCVLVSRCRARAFRTGSRWVPRHPCARRSSVSSGRRGQRRRVGLGQQDRVGCCVRGVLDALGHQRPCRCVRRVDQCLGIAPRGLAPGGEQLHHRRVAESERVVHVVDRRVEALRQLAHQRIRGVVEEEVGLVEVGLPGLAVGPHKAHRGQHEGQVAVDVRVDAEQQVAGTGHPPVPRRVERGLPGRGHGRPVAGLVAVVGVEVVLREHRVHVVDVRHVLEVARPSRGKWRSMGYPKRTGGLPGGTGSTSPARSSFTP